MGKWAVGRLCGRVCKGPVCRGWCLRCSRLLMVPWPAAPAGGGLHFQVSSRPSCTSQPGANVLSLINKTITASRAWLMCVILMAGPRYSYFCPNGFTLYTQTPSTSGAREVGRSSGVLACPRLANSEVDSTGGWPPGSPR